MSETIVVGDTVYLKTGNSPAMSVYEVNDDGRTYCSWFNSKNELSRDVFQKDQLTKSNPNTGGIFLG